MRLIGTVNTQDDAQAFGDYLVTVNLPNHIEQGRDGSWQVWIERDDDTEQGQLQLREFTANPNDPKYKSAASKALAIRREAEAQAEKRRRNFKDVRTSWSGVPRHATTLTLMLIGVSVIIYMLQQTEFGPKMMGQLFFFTPLRSLIAEIDGASLQTIAQMQDRFARAENLTIGGAFYEILHGQVWRLLTPALMHGSIIHLLFNCFYVLQFGSAIESQKGQRVFLPLVLLGAVISNCAQAIWQASIPFGGFGGFLGLSGINYALFGYVWMRGIVAPQERLGASQQTIGFMLAWMFLCMTPLVPNVANAAHVVGLIVGVIFGAWPRIVRTISRR